MTYDRVVSAALAETQSKFKLAEALALDIPPMRRGPVGEDERTLNSYMEEARQAIINAGGEPRKTATLQQYRYTGLWVFDEVRRNFRWINGTSYSAHEQARLAGFSYRDFASMPSKTVDAIRREAGNAGTDGPPEKIVSSWTPQQKTSAARELLSDPDVAENVVEDPQSRTRLEAATDRHYRRDEPTPKAQPRDTTRDYDQMVTRGVDLISVAIVAESSGRWTPTELSEALLYFLTQVLGNRREPTGEQADLINDKLNHLFDEVEAYANSEGST